MTLIFKISQGPKFKVKYFLDLTIYFYDLSMFQVWSHSVKGLSVILAIFLYFFEFDLEIKKKYKCQ